MTSYGDALADARQELDRLRALRFEVDLRIAKLERTISGLATLCGEPDIAPQGLTDACRSVLQSTTAYQLTPIEVRDELKKMGFDLSRYENPLAVIHTTLKRLAEQGEVTICLVAGGSATTAYRWDRDREEALRGLQSAADEKAVLQLLDEFTRKKIAG